MSVTTGELLTSRPLGDATAEWNHWTARLRVWSIDDSYEAEFILHSKDEGKDKPIPRYLVVFRGADIAEITTIVRRHLGFLEGTALNVATTATQRAIALARDGIEGIDIECDSSLFVLS